MSEIFGGGSEILGGVSEIIGGVSEILGGRGVSEIFGGVPPNFFFLFVAIWVRMTQSVK